jgi:hypothetical protein
MACPWVADGRDGLQKRRVAVNTLNKQSQTADKRWSFSLGVGLTTPHRKEIILLQNFTMGLGLQGHLETR